MMQHLFLPLLAILFSGGAVTAAGRYDNWLEREVKWIASRAEEESFKKLSDEEEQEVFIERFWGRRDPTPGTPQNEYKDEYYRRLEYVNEQFREGVPGWRTDRGRVYLIHGPPDRVDYVTPTDFAEQDTILWTYFNLPTAKYYRGRLVVVFKANIGPTIQDVRLGESTTGEARARRNLGRGNFSMTDMVANASRFKLVAAGPPSAINSRGLDIPASGIGEFARFTEDLLRPPGDLLEESDRERRRQQASRQELREAVTSKISYDRLPFAMSCPEFYSSPDLRLNVAWQLPLEALEFQEIGELLQARIDLIAQVRDEQGQLIDEFFKTLELQYSREDLGSRKAYYYLNEFTLDPGRYTISSVLRELQTGRMGTASFESDGSQFARQQIALSGLVLSHNLTDLGDTSINRDLVHEKWKIVPEADAGFSQSEQLILYFKIYEAVPTEEGNPEVIVNFDFFREGERVKSSGPRQLFHYTDSESGVIDFSSIIDLSSFEAGEYLIQVNAIDFQSRKYALQRARFAVHE